MRTSMNDSVSQSSVVIENHHDTSNSFGTQVNAALKRFDGIHSYNKQNPIEHTS